MEIAVKNIISPYIKIAPDQITVQTAIDRTAVNSSIMLHRMYAHLSKEGFSVIDYWEVKNFGMLLQKLNSSELISTAAPVSVVGVPTDHNRSTSSVSTTFFETAFKNETSSTPIGIDIEQISLLPPATDYREDAFYTMNFAPAEIAYCILQTNPVASFAGLFASKEAIVKADNHFLNQPFHTIIIDHLPNGKPVHSNFSLSISHTADVAIAVAVANIASSATFPPPANNNSSAMPFPNLKLLYLVAFSALFISLLVLMLYFIQ